MSRLFINHRSGKKAYTGRTASAINNKVNEEEERNSLNNTVCGAPLTSPSLKFYRNHSNPETVLRAAAVQETPNKIEDSRQQRSLGKFLRLIRPSSKKKKTAAIRDDDASPKQCENSPSQLSEDVDPSPLRNVPSQVYEQSVNKHGEVVDYAVPYSETPMAILDDSEVVADDNVLNESMWNDRLGDMAELQKLLSPVKITDLDKSSDGSKSLNQSGRGVVDAKNKELFSELDLLEKWSQNIAQSSLPLHEPPINKNVHIIECMPKEIKSKPSVLRSTFASPLHFASGSFRKTAVTLRTCRPRDVAALALAEEAIERDYEVLNNVKHANIILLMAVALQRKSIDHLTLVMEPVDFTLNYYLHQMDSEVPTVDSISIVQQIASAALYLQECGYIHSNICSHTILVRQSPWCVKLSSFELTTEADFADTRVDILVKYRHKEPPVKSSCPKSPRYATPPVPVQNGSLRDHYKRLSKMVPVFKCSPNTPHKYMSMLSQHVMYDTNYRQHLSLHNFQAPELLTSERQFVFPTIKSDVYSLCLLLWELLNHCVPFVVFSKVDMERMIRANKMHLPFFEADACAPLMAIFRTGLAVNPEDRTFDVQQLITMLDDVKTQIQNGCVPDVQEVNHYVNVTPKTTDTITSPDAADFNRCLLVNELTSTQKKRKISPRPSLRKNTFRQLFKNSSTSGNENVLTHAQLNENLEALASEIRREQYLDEIAEETESMVDSIVGPVVVKENVLPSTVSVENPSGRQNVSNEKTEWRKTSPETVSREDGDANHSANSKSCSNLFDAPTSDRRQHSTIVSPPGIGFSIGAYSLPDTPIARSNKIRRNAWLSNKSLNSSNQEIDGTAMEQAFQSPRLNNSGSQLNVSIRIVHSKVTPKKVESGNPSVMSIVKFFDSATGTSNIDASSSSNNKTNHNERVEDIHPSHAANIPINASSSKEIELASIEQHSLSNSQKHPPNETLSNCSTLTMSQKNGTISRLPPATNADQPSTLLEDKFWKRELEICSRSQCSNEADEDSNVITPRWQSVRDKILKFERRNESLTQPSSAYTTAMEFVKSLSRSTTPSQPNRMRFTETPTLIKRTIFTESIVSGVDLSALNSQMPLFDQLNSTGQKLTTQVTLNMRQVRRTSSDLDEKDRCRVEATPENRQAICGSQKGLLSCKKRSSKNGASGRKIKYICTDCTTKMSTDELKALNFEPVAESPFDGTDVTDYSAPSPMTSDGHRTPQIRCQVRVKSQRTRSIEDLYIDDDFDQVLGANIELLSDCSDFLNFDLISDVFDKSKVDLDIDTSRVDVDFDKSKMNVDTSKVDMDIDRSKVDMDDDKSKVDTDTDRSKVDLDT